MATYAFKALDLSGAPTKGEMEADDKQGVAAQLRSKGLIVVDIEEQAPASANDILARFRRVKADDLVVGTRQLSTMVQSGMSLLRALYVIEEQTENDKLREAWVAVRKDVEAGSPGIRTSSTSSTWRWCRPARPAASWTRPWSASPSSSRRTPRSAARSRRR
jgi:type IV pilus assembly protein PilC